MKIMTVDNEKLALDGLGRTIAKVVPDAEITAFRDPQKALEYGRNEMIDIAFLDINMFPLNGVELAKQLKKINPAVNIIFTTGYSEYTGEAMKLHASGYIMKPVTMEKVKREIEDLRYPVRKPAKPKLTVQTFGNFEAFANGEPIHFGYTKTKELLAYLVDRRGSLCTNGEIMAILWEDDASERHTSYLKNLRKDLKNTLEGLDLSDVLIQRRGMIGIVPDEIECDYYDCLAGKQEAIMSYGGEYMAQYSWAEYTHGELERLI
jgi:two-component SAPR family response regulator